MERDLSEQAREDEGTQTQARYDAFMSYSHADQALAERLSRRIGSYRPPRALGLGRRRLQVFRDVERLTTGADLSQVLAERINGAAHLILLCSPDAASSSDVDREVAAFLEHKGRDALHAVLAQGEARASFSARVRSALPEPLYVDLRPAGGWLTRRRRFREGSLRLIATLLGVDFTKLRREDESRRRRRRNAIVLGVLLGGLALGSAYLIDRVPPDVWAPVALPTDHHGAPLLPVTDYAVYQPDPGILVFRVFGAEYAAERPKSPIGVRLQTGALDTEAFVEAAREHLIEHPTRDGALSPLAILRFEVIAARGAGNAGGASEALGHGEIRIYGYLDAVDQRLRFARTLDYRGKNGTGESKRLLLPPTGRFQQEDPFDLDPWPADALTDAGLLPTWGVLRGGLVPAWGDGAEVPLSYETVDNLELFLEGNDGRWFEQALVSNVPEAELRIGSQSAPGHDLDPVLWQDIQADIRWAVYRPPLLQRHEQLHVRRDEDSKRTVHTAGGPVWLDEGLVDVLEQRLEDAPELDHTVTIVTREQSGGALSFVTVVSRRCDEVARTAEHTGTLYLLRAGDAQVWTVTGLKPPDEEAAVVDILSLGSDDRRLLALTDREGFFASDDAGATWRGFNFQESSLLNGANVRTVVAGGRPMIYALVDNSQSHTGTRNRLLRYQRRGWLERLRVSLIGLLGGSRP